MKVYAVRLILRNDERDYTTILKAEWEEEEYIADEKVELLEESE